MRLTARWRIGYGPAWTRSAGYSRRKGRGQRSFIPRLSHCYEARTGRSVRSVAAGQFRSTRGRYMRRTPAIAALAAVAALAVAGCSSSGSSSSAGGGSSSSASGNTVDIYSSLPLQGASTAQTIPMVNGIKLALSQADDKAGQWTVNYQSLDDSTAAAGKWDPGQTAANARKVATDPEGRLLHRRVQLGRQRGVDPDPQPGGNPPGEPGEHLRRPDDRTCPAALPASRRSTTRAGPVPTCGSCRSTRSRPPPT